MAITQRDGERTYIERVLIDEARLPGRCPVASPMSCSGNSS